MQRQTQTQMSLLEVKQSQELKNSRMCTLAARLESYALALVASKNYTLNGYRQKYGYYDIGDSLNTMDLPEIEKQIRLALSIFESDYMEFTAKFGTYLMPDNLSKEELIKDINGWINIIYELGTESDLRLYDTAVNVIQGMKIGWDVFANMPKTRTNTETESTQHLIDCTMSSTKTFMQTEKRVKESVNSGKGYSVLMKLYQSCYNNPNYCNIARMNAARRKGY